MSILSWVFGSGGISHSDAPGPSAREAEMDEQFAALAEQKVATERQLSEVMGTNRNQVQTIVSMSRRMALVADVNELRRRASG